MIYQRSSLYSVYVQQWFVSDTSRHNEINFKAIDILTLQMDTPLLSWKFPKRNSSNSIWRRQAMQTMRTLLTIWHFDDIPWNSWHENHHFLIRLHLIISIGIMGVGQKSNCVKRNENSEKIACCSGKGLRLFYSYLWGCLCKYVSIQAKA